MPATQEDYTIHLDAFEGPLDLLLYLIRRAEVDVQDIPIAQITDQYLLALRQVEAVDVELAGDFLVMAATLLELKSRSLAPLETTGDDPEADPTADAGDPRQELIRQLLAYQRIRTAGESLDERRFEFDRRNRIRIRPSDEAMRVEESDGLDLDDVHLMDLADAYEHIASAIDFDRLGDHHVAVDDVPIALYKEDLLDRLQRRDGDSLTLQDTFAGRGDVHRVGLFLALLELVRMRQVKCQQDNWGGPIELELCSEEEWVSSDEFEDESEDEPSATDSEVEADPAGADG